MTTTVDDEEEAGDPAAAVVWKPDFHWLTEELAVGACFPSDRAPELASKHGIVAVVDLREEACDDEEALKRAGIALLHLPTPDLEPASVAMLEEGVGFVRQAIAKGGRVLIHCQHGIGRSPLLSLCVLVDAGWQPLEALSHAKTIRERVSPSRSQFEGWTRWLRSRGVAAPDYHTFGCIAYRHLANG
jgi:predicted protein tyrosine phosphatase